LQAFVAAAPVNLIYVADLSKTGQAGSEAELFTAADAGFIGENVYLFCASEGLATVVRGSVDRAALAKIMKLGAESEDSPGAVCWLSEEVACSLRGGILEEAFKCSTARSLLSIYRVREGK